MMMRPQIGDIVITKTDIHTIKASGFVSDINGHGFRVACKANKTGWLPFDYIEQNLTENRRCRDMIDIIEELTAI